MDVEELVIAGLKTIEARDEEKRQEMARRQAEMERAAQEYCEHVVDTARRFVPAPLWPYLSFGFPNGTPPEIVRLDTMTVFLNVPRCSQISIKMFRATQGGDWQLRHFAINEADGDESSVWYREGTIQEGDISLALGIARREFIRYETWFQAQQEAPDRFREAIRRIVADAEAQ